MSHPIRSVELWIRAKPCRRAAGTGDNACLLAQTGYDSFAIDISINGLGLCLAKARRNKEMYSSSSLPFSLHAPTTFGSKKKYMIISDKKK